MSQNLKKCICQSQRPVFSLRKEISLLFMACVPESPGFHAYAKQSSALQVVRRRPFSALRILPGVERDLESGSRCRSDGIPSSRPRDTPLQGSRCSSGHVTDGQDDNMLTMGPSATEMIDKDEASCSKGLPTEPRPPKPPMR